MNSKHLKAASWYTISNFISKILIYCLTPFYARTLTIWEYGQYSNFLSWQHIISAIITLDLSATVAISYVDYKDENKFEQYISTITLFGVFFPLLVSIIIISFSSYFSKLFNMDSNLLIIMMISISLGNSLGIFQAENRQRLKYKLASFISVIGSCLCVPLILILLVCLSNKLYAVVIGSNLALIGINLIATGLILKRCLYFEKEYVIYALKITLPLIPHVLAANILGSSDKIMITKIRGSEETALYSIVYTCAMVLNVLVTSVNSAWVPWLFAKIKEKKFNSIQQNSKKISLFLGGIVLLLCLVSPEILYVIGGDKYMIACYAMPPIIMSCFVRYIYTLYVNIEFYNKKTFGISIGTIVSSTINIGLNYIGIVRFGYLAAAYSTLISMIFLLIIHTYIVYRQDCIGIYDNKYNYIFLSTLFFASSLLMLTYSFSKVRYLIIISFIFVSCIYAYKNKEIIQSYIKAII